MSSTYEEWNRALCERFLVNDVPVYLYTDGSVLEEVAGEVGVDTTMAVDSFIDAVVGTLDHREPFKTWAERTRHLDTTEPPPHLAVLCFLVMVAVEQEARKFSYYPELNRLLGRDSRTAPPGFDEHVPNIFVRFNEWLLANDGQRGLPTARPSRHYPNIGWALSQALVRPADRRLLSHLFVEVGLRPRSALTGRQIRAKVRPRLLVAADSPSKRRLTTLDSEHPELFLEILEQEFGGWTGAVFSGGPQRVPLRLCFDATYGDWWFTCRPVAGLEGHEWRIGGRTGTMRPHKGLEATPPNLWELVGEGDVGFITNGPSLTSAPARLRWLSIDRGVGGWAETRHRDRTLEQMLLVEGTGLDGLPDAVKRREDAPRGFSLYEVPAGVDITGERDDLATRVAAKPTFAGGLVLRAATNTYLHCDGGLPDIVGVTVDVTLHDSPLPAADGRVSLNARHLKPGVHEFVADGHQLRLVLVPDLQAPPFSRDPAWIDDVPDGVHLGVPHNGRDKAAIWLVGSEGELERRTLALPTWPHLHDLLAGEVDLTGIVQSTWFAPAFVVSESYMGKPYVSPVPGEIARPRSGEPRRPFDPDAARRLVTLLLTGYGPTERHEDRRWKRSFAEVMRMVNR